MKQQFKARFLIWAFFVMGLTTAFTFTSCDSGDTSKEASEETEQMADSTQTEMEETEMDQDAKEMHDSLHHDSTHHDNMQNEEHPTGDHEHPSGN